MELNLFCRALCIVALICTYTVADPTNEVIDSQEDSSSLMESVEKREPFKKLRSHNPILIFHQSIRQPRYLPRISSLTDGSVGGYDIPRRLIRKGNNKTHSSVAPLLVWNHQLLPNFYNKRQPPFFMTLRRDGYSTNTKMNQPAKRSSLGWLLLPKSYGEVNAQEFPYETLQLPENEDDYDVENDPNEPLFPSAGIKDGDF